MYGFIKELGKIEIEYTYKESEEKKIVFKNYVKRVETDYILIDFLSSDGIEYNLPLESWLTVKFKEKAGVYSGYCQIIGKDNSRLPGIKITYPTDIEFVQQREYVRAPIKLKIELAVFPLLSGSEKPETEGVDVKVYDINTLDISGSGFSFVSNKPIEKHSKIVGIIQLSNPAEKPFEVLLKHIYSRIFIAAGKEVYKNAFTFTDINEKLREKIVKEIFLYELELRKKRI